jgi:D-arabinose 1-dehydrogenase-like Zn-dependent alcohol dehydrogenase
MHRARQSSSLAVLHSAHSSNGVQDQIHYHPIMLASTAASGKVKVMTETYSLDEISKAYERVADDKVRFRAVITTSN